jgi:hypothetical protein
VTDFTMHAAWLVVDMSGGEAHGSIIVSIGNRFRLALVQAWWPTKWNSAASAASPMQRQLRSEH